MIGSYGQVNLQEARAGQVVDIRQVTDVLHRNLQHHLSCNCIRQVCARPGASDSAGGIMPGASASPAGTGFLTVFEVAAIMRVSKRTVYRLVHDGHLEAAKVRGSFRIPDHAVMQERGAPRSL
jgi:excisionase family DNA binding protein